jgi:hypothetical protein
VSVSEISSIESSVERFWAQYYSADMPPFEAQLASLALYPRNNILISCASADDGERRFSESDGMLELPHRIAEADRMLASIDDPRTTGARRFLRLMQKRFSFLGMDEYKLACRGVGQAWVNRLQKYPNAAINLIDMKYDEKGEPSESHSYNRVPQDVIATIMDPDVRKRIICEPRDWHENERSVLVAVDDWMVSGKVAEQLALRARREARAVGKLAMLGQFELHLLVAANDRLGRREFLLGAVGDYSIPGAVRSFYRTQAREQSMELGFGTFLSGAHASVDYDFDMPFRDIRGFLERRGFTWRLPLLAYIKRDY